MNIITRTVSTEGVHSADYYAAATKYNRFARAQNRRLILGITGLILGLLTIAGVTGISNGYIHLYNGINTGICVQNVGGLEIVGPDGIGFFDGQDC